MSSASRTRSRRSSRSPGAGSGRRNVAPDTLLRYCEDECGQRYFEEIVEPSAHSLVPADAAQEAVQELLRRGPDLRDVAALAGVSLGAAQRAAAGHGYVRRATAAALEAAALNG